MTSEFFFIFKSPLSKILVAPLALEVLNDLVFLLYQSNYLRKKTFKFVTSCLFLMLGLILIITD